MTLFGPISENFQVQEYQNVRDPGPFSNALNPFRPITNTTTNTILFGCARHSGSHIESREQSRARPNNVVFHQFEKI